MANKYATVSGAGSKTGGSWADAFGLTELLTDLNASATAGDFYYVEEGTYTLATYFQALNDGTADAPISVIGVASGTLNEPPVASDHATGTNRPLIACGANSFFCDNLWHWENVRWTTAHSAGVDVDIAAVFINCYFEQTSTYEYPALRFGGASVYIQDCEFVASSGGYGLNAVGDGTIINCYFHDCSAHGIRCASANLRILECIFDTCGSCGVYIQYYSPAIVLNNNFYNCTSGLSLEIANCVIFNNNFVSNTTGLLVSSASLAQAYVDYNNYYGNTTDVANITKGPNDMAVDPQFTDAPNGDFSLDSTSELIGAGRGIVLGVGL